MQRLLLLCMGVILVVVCSCSGLSKADEVEKNIPGTYIRLSEHEFGREYDTMLIEGQNKPVHQYRIIRKWKYERRLDGAAIEPEYKKIITSGVYNANNKLLEESETGAHFSFDVKKKLLFKGSTEYQKIK